MKRGYLLFFIFIVGIVGLSSVTEAGRGDPPCPVDFPGSVSSVNSINVSLNDDQTVLTVSGNVTPGSHCSGGASWSEKKGTWIGGGSIKYMARVWIAVRNPDFPIPPLPDSDYPPLLMTEHLQESNQNGASIGVSRTLDVSSLPAGTYVVRLVSRHNQQPANTDLMSAEFTIIGEAPTGNITVEMKLSNGAFTKSTDNKTVQIMQGAASQDSTSTTGNSAAFSEVDYGTYTAAVDPVEQSSCTADGRPCKKDSSDPNYRGTVTIDDEDTSPIAQIIYAPLPYLRLDAAVSSDGSCSSASRDPLPPSDADQVFIDVSGSQLEAFSGGVPGIYVVQHDTQDDVKYRITNATPPSGYTYCGSTPEDGVDLLFGGNDGTLTAKFVRIDDIPDPTCSLGFSSSPIWEGGSVDLNWSSNRDADGELPYSCVGDLGDGILDDTSGTLKNLEPTDDQTCTAIVEDQFGRQQTCSASIDVTPIFNAQSTLTISPPSQSVAVGGQGQFWAWFDADGSEGSDFSSQNVSSLASWTITNDSIASITQTGSVTGQGVGSTGVQATYYKTANATLSVTFGPDFSCFLDPSLDVVDIIGGDTITEYTVEVRALNGYSGSINLSLPPLNNLIAPLSGSFDDSSLYLNGGTENTILNINVPSSALLGRSTFEVKVDDGSVSHTCSADIEIKNTIMPVASLSANPSSIKSGESADLLWQCQNSLKGLISPSVGTVMNEGTIDDQSGNKEVEPSESIKYTLKCSNYSGIDTDDATVTVPGDALSCNVSGNPNQWSSAPADVVLETSAFGGVGSYEYRFNCDDEDSSWSSYSSDNDFECQYSAVRPYTAEAEVRDSSGTSVPCDVNLNSSITAQLNLDAKVSRDGGAKEFLTSSEAAKVKIRYSEYGDYVTRKLGSYQYDVSSGNVILGPFNDFEKPDGFELSHVTLSYVPSSNIFAWLFNLIQVQAAGGSVTVTLEPGDSETVTFHFRTVEEPEGDDLSCTMDVVPGIGEVGESLAFSVNASGGSPPYGYQYNFNDGQSSGFPDYSSPSSIMHSYDTPSLFYQPTGEVKDASDGTASCSTNPAVVRIVDSDECSLTASPSPILSGQSSTLTWSCTVPDDKTCSISQGIGEVDSSGGSTVVSPSDSTTYTLSCTGVLDDDASVNVGFLPVIREIIPR